MQILFFLTVKEIRNQLKCEKKLSSQNVVTVVFIAYVARSAN